MKIERIEASDAKSTFDDVLDRCHESDIAITERGRVRAFIISPSRFRAMASNSVNSGDNLHRLEEEFEALVLAMQSAAHRRTTDTLETMPLHEVLRKGRDPTK